MAHDEEFELKPLSADALEAAMEKMKRYRLLNEAQDAESICRDILRVDPDYRGARVGLMLCLTDQFEDGLAGRVSDATEIAESLPNEYDQFYYKGVICERRAKVHHGQRSPQSGCLAHNWLSKAMGWFEKASACRPKGNDGSLLRWNTCARMIMNHDDIRPSVEEEPGPPDMLE